MWHVACRILQADQEVPEEPEEVDASDDENDMLRERLELLKKLHQDLDE